MKLVIGEDAYDMEETLNNASLNDLFYLKTKTRCDEFPKGVSMRSLAEGLKKWGEYEDPSDILDDAEALMNLRALVFLCKRHTGEKCSVEDANNFPISQFSFEVEDGDEVTPEDPQEALTDSGQGDVEATTPATSKTSKRRSTSGSRPSPTSGEG